MSDELFPGGPHAEGAVSRRMLVLALMLICANVLAIGVEYELETGWVPRGYFGWRDGEGARTYDLGNTLYVELGLWVLPTPWLYLGGSVTVQMSVASVWPPVLDPTFTNYGVEGGFRLGSVDLFISHDCSHPQLTHSPRYRVTSLWGEGGVTRVGLRVSNFRGGKQ